MRQLKCLEGKSDIAKEYFEISKKMMLVRIKSRMKDEKGEGAYTNALDTICAKATEAELAEIDSLPSYWWFQYIENGQPTEKSELDVYEDAKYFTRQEPMLVDPPKMKGKPFFGGDWKEGDAMFVLCIDGPDLAKPGHILRQLVTMANRQLPELSKDYTFTQYAGNFPVFTKKNKEPTLLDKLIQPV